VDEVEVELCTAGLNFKESLIVLGMLDTGYDAARDVPMGFEGAGRITKVGTAVRDLASGDEVIVWANGCLASHVITKRNNVIKFDTRKISYDQAAGLSTVFMTAYFGLCVLARVQKGDRVLIHAAAGGVGQAAIQIARAAGAHIYATASRPKWEYLSSQGITQIFDSRDVRFRDAIMEATGGQGVTIVLNALAGEFIEKSFDVLAAQGRFIEIGKQNIWSAERANTYRPDVTYHAFELGLGAAAAHSALELWLRPCLEAIYSGTYQLLPVRVFPLDEIVAAFRWLAGGRNIGKAVIRVRDAFRSWTASPIGSDKHYLVSGGLGALGLHVAQWLVRNGARQIMLLGRHLPSHGVSEQLRRLRAEGAAIKIRNCDISDKSLMAGMLAGLPRVAGVFHCAGLIDDGVLVNLTSERFQKVLLPKAYGVQVLHELTLGTPLEHFVCFSSTSALIDGAGQANYAAASAYLDSFVLYRRTLGLAGLTINWGGWAGSGLAADLALRKPSIASEFITKEEGLAALEYLLRDGRASAVVSRMRGRLESRNGPRPMFQELCAMASDMEPAPSELTLSSATDPAVAIAHALRLQVARVLGVKEDEVRDDDDFVELGIDSLMLAELRNNVQKVLSRKIPATAFFAHPNIRALTQHVAAEHLGEPAERSLTPKAVGGVATLSRKRDGDRLFCIPGHGENILDFRHLAECAGDSCVSVLHAGESYLSPSFEPDEITFLAKRHVAAVTSVQPAGPYRILAHSFGGVIAVEVAIQLVASGQLVEQLVLLDSVPTFWYRDDLRYRRRAHVMLFSTLFESLSVGADYATGFYSRIKDMTTDRALAYFRESILTVGSLNHQDVNYIVDSFKRRLDITYRPNVKLLADVRVVHVKATRAAYALADAEAMRIVQANGAYGWEEILDTTTTRLQMVEMECTHKEILKPPFINEVTRILSEGYLEPAGGNVCIAKSDACYAVV
jgi:NADPH:quinone reductase-like Zn-dependent oxidoreductase/thioesterase domain-containing protein/acyl carrier protein